MGVNLFSWLYIVIALIAKGRSLAAVASEVKNYGDHGSLGMLPSNEHTERSVRRALKKQLGISPYTVSLTLKNKKTGALVETPVNMILPHEMFARMYQAGDNYFQKSVLGNVDLAEFWKAFEFGDPGFWTQHVQLPVEKQKDVIPISWHSDGVIVFKFGEMTVWSWSSPLVRGDALNTKHIACVLPTSLVSSYTESQVVAVLSWSLKSMMVGKYPESNHLGKTWLDISDQSRANLGGKNLRGRFLAVHLFWKGDHKERKRVHELTRSWQHNYVCERDLASKVIQELTYGDASSTAGWRLTAFGSHLDHTSTSPWKQISTFSHARVLDDLTHVLYLGVARDFTASIIIDLCMRGEASSPESIWYSAREWARSNKLTFNSPVFTWTSLKRTSNKRQPCMDSQVKAAHMKVLLKYIAVLCAQHVQNIAEVADFDESHAKLRGACAYHCALMVDVWSKRGFILPTAASNIAVESGKMFLLTYQQLAVNSLEAKTALFKWRPKTHYLIHLLEFTAKYRFNPHWLNCMCDEDLMGKIKKILSGCYPTTLATNGILRYLTLRVLQMTRLGKPVP